MCVRVCSPDLLMQGVECLRQVTSIIYNLTFSSRQVWLTGSIQGGDDVLIIQLFK